MKVGILTVDWASKWRLDDTAWVDNEGVERGTPAMGGSGHIRIAQYLPYVDFDYVLGGPVFDPKRGIFGVMPCNAMKWLIDNNGKERLLDVAEADFDEYVWDCDVIYTQRYMWHEGLAQTIQARANGQIIIQDVDDWYWGLHKDNVAYDRTDPKKNPFYHRDAYWDSLRAANAIAASTPFLVNRLKEANERTYLMENHVDLDAFTPWNHYHEDETRVGWVGSPAYRSGDLAVLKPFVNMFPFVHSGHDIGEGARSFHDETGVRGIHVLPQTTPDRYPELFQFDVGTVPLNDIEFNHAKSWIKGIEYVAAGIPFIATPVSEYRRLQDEYGIGILAKKTKDWVKHLKRLMPDPDLRTSIAKEQLEAIQPLDVKLGAKKLTEFLEATQ